jgi:HK97 family phage portal protein
LSANVGYIDKLTALDEQQAKIAIERNLTLEKALKSGDVDAIFKAQKYAQQFQRIGGQMQRSDGMKSMVLDPFITAGSQGYFDKVSQLSYDLLRGASRAPIIRSIINTRKDQVAEYCKPQEDKYSKGFIFKKKGVKDEDEYTDADKRVMDQLTEFIMSCGNTDQDSDKWDPDANFEIWVRKMVEDSLALDQACSEVVTTRAFEPYLFRHVDGATIRIADSYDNENNTKDVQKVRGYFPTHVQIYQGRVHAEYYPWEMIFGIRNPGTSLMSNGYGRGEIEDLISTITAMLNADAYNAKFFKNGSTPNGALLVKKGNLNPDKLNELRAGWNAMMSGVQNAHKTPVLDAEAVEWLDFHRNNRDMEYHLYQEYLIKLACGVFKISPEEIGFPLEGQGGGKLGNDSGKEEKKYSVDKGLKPLLTSIQGWLNKHVVGPKTNGQWSFQFAGVETETASQEEERLIKAGQSYLEVNEIRKIRGLKPKPGYDIILNPIIAQQRQMQQEQQNQSDEQEQDNNNPFLSEEDVQENPMTKSFVNWWENTLVNNS